MQAHNYIDVIVKNLIYAESQDFTIIKCEKSNGQEYIYERLIFVLLISIAFIIFDLNLCREQVLERHDSDEKSFGSFSYECVNEPRNVTGSTHTTECPETDDQGETLYCQTFTQQIKGVKQKMSLKE